MGFVAVVIISYKVNSTLLWMQHQNHFSMRFLSICTSNGSLYHRPWLDMPKAHNESTSLPLHPHHHHHALTPAQLFVPSHLRGYGHRS